MYEYYFDTDSGKQFEIHPSQLDDFRLQYPKAYKIDMYQDDSFDDTLPTVTSEVTALGEKQGVQRLKKMFGGLGWDFKEDDSFLGYFGRFGGGTGLGFDRVIAIAPPDENGERKEQTFEFDLDLGLPAIGKSKNSEGDDNIAGDFWESSSALSINIGAEGVANDMNKFIRENTNLTNFDERAYAQTWNYANKLLSQEELEAMSSEELKTHVDETFNKLMFGDKKIPGSDRIFRNINYNLEQYSAKAIVELRKKYDLNTEEGYKKANEEYQDLVTKEHDRLFKESDELQNVGNSIVAALESRYGISINDKERKEAENATLPAWVTGDNFFGLDSDMIRQGYITTMIKFPKAFNEVQILHRGKKLANLQNSKKELEKLDPNAPFVSPFGEPTGFKTNADAIKSLNTQIYNLNVKIAEDMMDTQDYQERVKAARVPTAFGKTISDPDLTIDEWQGMLGDQIVQMFSAVITGGGSTYIQEAGGAAIEIIEIEAAMKRFPVLGQYKKPTDQDIEGKGLNLGPMPAPPSDEEWKNMSDKEQEDWRNGIIKPKDVDFENALKQFRKLPEDDYVENGVEMPGRRSLMLEVLNSGEVNLTPAVIVGLVNAGADLGSTIFTGGTLGLVGKTGAKVFIPKSFWRNLTSLNAKGTLTSSAPLLAAGGVETGTELFQEGSSVTGVGIATGYYGNRQKNLKRYFEAGTQALLSTIPLVGGGATIKSTYSDVKANYRASKDPNYVRNAINKLKRETQEEYEDGKITVEKRNKRFDELESEEAVINKYKEYSDMDIDQKQIVINNNIEFSNNSKELTRLEAENKELRQGMDAEILGGVNTNQIRNNEKIKNLKEKQKDLLNKRFQELRIVNDVKSRKNFVQHVIENPELYNNAKPIDLMTKDRATEYFKELGFLSPKNKYYKPIQRLLNKEVNAVEIPGVGVFSVQQLRHEIIREGRGYGTSNAFHHDILHVIQENLSRKELKEAWSMLETQMLGTGDPTFALVYTDAIAKFEQRYGKIRKGTKNYYLELFASVSDAMKEYSLTQLTENSGQTLNNIANYFSDLFQTKTKVGTNWSNFGPENAFEHLKEYTNFYGQRASLSIPPISIRAKQVDLEEQTEAEAKASEVVNDELVKFLKEENYSNEDLAIMYQSPSTLPEQKNAIASVLYGDFVALAIDALGYTEEKGSIPRENVVGEIGKYFVSVVNNFDKTKGAFSTHVYGNFNRKQAVIFEAAKVKEKLDTESLDTESARQIADTEDVETKSFDETKVVKTDVLSLAKVSNKIKELKEVVDVKVGDTFKDISKFVGPVGEIIFDIPAIKITDGNENITTSDNIVDVNGNVISNKELKAGKKGIPSPSEAKNIQDFFAVADNMEKSIKILPKENVTAPTADINKIGENISVSRDVLGLAIGLKGRPQNYFYEDFIDPEGIITSPSGRSKGLSSQTKVTSLKEEFINPDLETIEKVKKDLGITPKMETNIKPTGAQRSSIGQLLKGLAKVISQQVAFSTAQRKLADLQKQAEKRQKQAELIKDAKEKLKAREQAKQEVQEIKQTIANITTAQSKAAFSEVLDGYYEGFGNVDLNFEIEQKIANAVVSYHFGTKMHTYKTVTEIDNAIKDIKEYIIPILPGNVLTYNTFLKNNRHLGSTRKNIVTTPDGKKMQLQEYYKQEIKKLTYDGNKIGRGKEFTGPGAKYKQGRTYSTYFGDTSKEIAETNSKGRKIGGVNMTIKQINEMHASMWTQMWQKVDKSIKDTNGKSARIWANWFSTVSQNTEHPHRMGAELLGWSKNPIGAAKLKGGDVSTNPKTAGYKLYEWEHAMPASRAYNYLLHSSFSGVKASKNFKNYNFKAAFNLVQNNFKLIALDNYDDKVKLKGSGRQESMGEGWTLIDNWFDRYFDEAVALIENGIDPKGIQHINGKTFDKVFNVTAKGRAKHLVTAKQKAPLKKATEKARSSKYSEVSRGITILDFDDTLATTNSLVKYTTEDGRTGTLNAEQYASTYQDLLDQGYTFDFSEFNKVVGGKIAPLFQKALKLQRKFGAQNMFVLTARPPAAAQAIFDFLKANGLNIPLKNITGLGNSTAEAKALWVADKVGEGYNDFYFADDALQNVQAVDNILEQFDVKRKVQQAKVKFSETLDSDFNQILEDVTGIEAEKIFSLVKSRKRGAKKGRFRFFIPPSHEDFVGLLYNFLGKGERGNRHRDFFEKVLIKPLNRAYRELNMAQQAIANDYASLNKQMPEVRKLLLKKTPDGDFTYQDAIRVYLWNKHGYEINGLSKTDENALVEIVMSDPDLRTYAESLNVLSKQENYVEPNESWEAGDIRTDLIDATGRIGRAKFFEEFFENADIIFSDKNLNKIRAAYGEGMVNAIQDMLYRIKTGRNRPAGQNKHVNQFMNWLNGSVAATMFFNIRSMVLQQMSMVNFINFADNNIYRAAKAFANQKQYWSDWSFLFNSDFMKQRRGGIMIDVNGAELAATVKDAKNPVQALIKKLLQLGFTPTQIGDNIAIATGGAPFYRNRINTYIKEGLSKKEAEEKAFIDFQILAEATQQSARPDMVSQQQASALGKVILAFQNVTSQFNRIGKKAFLDLKNRRITPGNKTQFQSDISNMSRIAYYFAVQNLIFYTLQTALFAAIFDDDEDDKKLIKKKEYAINGSIDSVLRGTGVYGSIVATLKNMAKARYEQQNLEKGQRPDPYAVLVEGLQVSPPVGIKARKIVMAEKDLVWNKKLIEELDTFDIDNPIWSAYTAYVEGITNVPLNRLYRKTLNVRESLNNQHTVLQRGLMFSGWSKWNLDIPDTKKVKKKKKKYKQKYVDPF